MKKVYICLEILVLLSYVSSNPLPNGNSSISEEKLHHNDEIDDLADSNLILREQEKSRILSSSHRDEDQFDTKEVLKDLKLDVEILESNEIPQETNVELEEQFKGNAPLQTQTSQFSDENIEMIADESKLSIQDHHLYTTIGIILLALISISIYAVLVIWRNKLEKRYGMRELLVTDDYDEYYRQLQRNDSLPYVNNATISSTNSSLNQTTSNQNIQSKNTS